MAAEMTSAPEVFRNSRRVSMVMRVLLRHVALRALDGAQDGNMRTAAALEARERLAQLGIARLRAFFQERGRGHDPAIHAVATLRHLFGDIGRLQRMRLVRRAKP